jgi:hypothetical protein
MKLASFWVLAGALAAAAAAAEGGVIAVAAPTGVVAGPATESGGLPLLFHEDFRDGDRALARFEFLDPKAWKVAKDGDRNVLSLFDKAKVEPPVRSPYGRALVKDLWVGPFVMEVRLRSTVKDYPHRDLCLFWGAVDDRHEYYAHLGKAPDPHCHNIFLVDDADRRNLLPVQTKGIDWDDDYHTARVVRAEDGTTEVLLDGRSVMKVKDTTLGAGRVGFGSFDDLGNFAEVTVWGKNVQEPATAK